MHSMHRGSSIVRAAHLIAKSDFVCNRCAVRYFHQQRPLRQDDNGAPADTTASSTPPARPATRRQGSQVAGRMIQGLRFAAPGGFGTKKTEPRTPSQPSARSIPLERTSTRTAQSEVTSTQIIRQQEPPRRRNAASSRANREDRRDAGEGRSQFGQAEDQEARRQAAQNSLVARLRASADPTVDLEAAHMANDLPLARRFLKQQVVRFADEKEKERVLKLANELVGKQPVQGYSKDVVFTPVPAAYRDVLSKKAIAGKYDPIRGIMGKTAKERTMSRLKSALQLNESYSPQQQQALMGFIDRMWPAQKAAQRKTA